MVFENPGGRDSKKAMTSGLRSTDAAMKKDGIARAPEDEQLKRLERRERETRQGPQRPKRRSLSPEQRREILNELFFEGAARAPYIKQFYSLLTLAGIIATFGLIIDSTAVVIGAMLLSPLMTPILGIAASLVMGWPQRAGRVAIRLFIATAFVFGLAWLIPWIMQFPTSIHIPDEILGRTNPNFADLLVALCAGLAAAYMLVRKEAISALPGVAIAVALVPPLCVSGLLTYFTEYHLAWEAFVLYFTNLTAIVLMAGAVLLVMGFKPKVRDLRLHLRVTAGLMMASGIVALVAIPLGQRTFNDIRDLHDRVVAYRVIEDWIGENPVELIDVEVEDNLIQVKLLINLPFSSFPKSKQTDLRAYLTPEMTIEKLKQQLIETLNKQVNVSLKGTFVFGGSI